MSDLTVGRIEQLTQPAPGPWTLHGKYPSARVVAGDFEILVTRDKAGAVPDVWLATTRLIAAAPELLAVCQRVVRMLGPTQGSDAVADSVLKQARAAIAKAEGQ